jgi:uncharacterized membrane protein
MVGETEQSKKDKGMEAEVIGLLIALTGSAVGLWVKMTTELARVKARLFSLEQEKDELKAMLKVCVDGIQELKILLAKKGM